MNRPLTVRELIQHLAALDPDLPVGMRYDGSCTTFARGVSVEPEMFDRDGRDEIVVQFAVIEEIDRHEIRDWAYGIADVS